MPSLDLLTENAKIAEETALSIEGITNNKAIGCSSGSYTHMLVTSNGFSGTFKKTMFGISCAVLAGEGTNMECDYAYSNNG